MLAPPAISVGRFVGLCVVLAPLPNSTIVLSSTLPLRSWYSLQPPQEVGDLLAEEQVVLGELQLPVLVLGVRQIVVRSRQAELERERVADAHAVFAIEHERDRARDVGVERQRDQVEHVAVVFAGSPSVVASRFRCE